MLQEVNYLEYLEESFYNDYKFLYEEIYERCKTDFAYQAINKDKLFYALTASVKAFDMEKNQLAELCHCRKEDFVSDINNLYNRIPLSIKNVSVNEWGGFVPKCSGIAGLCEIPEWMEKKVYIDDGILYPVYNDNEYSIHLFSNQGHKIIQNKEFYLIRNIELRAMYKLHEECNENSRRDLSFDFETLAIPGMTDFRKISSEEARKIYLCNKTNATMISGEFLAFLKQGNTEVSYKAPTRNALEETKNIKSEKPQVNVEKKVQK